MSAVAFEITGISIVYSNVCSDTDRRKHQSPASLALVMGITGDRWFPRTKGQWRGKSFLLMTSSWPQCVKDSLNAPTSMHALWWNRIPQHMWKAYSLSNYFFAWIMDWWTIETLFCHVVVAFLRNFGVVICINGPSLSEICVGLHFMWLIIHHMWIPKRW